MWLKNKIGVLKDGFPCGAEGKIVTNCSSVLVGFFFSGETVLVPPLTDWRWWGRSAVRSIWQFWDAATAAVMLVRNKSGLLSPRSYRPQTLRRMTRNSTRILEQNPHFQKNTQAKTMWTASAVRDNNDSLRSWSCAVNKWWNPSSFCSSNTTCAVSTTSIQSKLKLKFIITRTI